jgi:hypothetical protein
MPGYLRIHLRFVNLRRAEETRFFEDFFTVFRPPAGPPRARLAAFALRPGRLLVRSLATVRRAPALLALERTFLRALERPFEALLDAPLEALLALLRRVLAALPAALGAEAVDARAGLRAGAVASASRAAIAAETSSIEAMPSVVRSMPFPR